MAYFDLNKVNYLASANVLKAFES